MLVLGSKTVTVDGVTVFADHADPNQFWYLPAPVVLAERDDVPQFTLIRYRPAVAAGGVHGGGFLMMEVELRLAPDVERRILGAVSRFSGGQPRLTPVPFDEGTVQVVALNIQGGGGTTAAAPPPGAFVAVESILGATKPSLGGNNSAVFSLTLSQEGSIILDQAFREGATPVGVIYDLKYTALRPALDVRISANFKRIYDKLSFGVDLTAGAVIYGVPVYLEAGIDMAFEKLKQDGVISIEVINFTNTADADEKEKWALDFFKQNLLQQWFQPTLAPITFDRRPTTGGTTPGGTTPAGGTTTPAGGTTTPAGGTTTPAGGTTTPAGGTSPSGGTTPAGGTIPAGAPRPPSSGAPAGGASAGGAPAGGAPAGGAPAGGAPAGGGAHPAGGEAPHESALVSQRAPAREVWAYPFLETGGRQAARLDKRVAPEAPGYDVTLSQSQENDQIKLTFLGGSDAPTVRINGAAQTLNAQREVLLELPGGASWSVEADYPASAAAPREFKLYFDFDKPRSGGWSVTPPSTAYAGYLANRTNPLDSRFETSTGGDGAAAAGLAGADALRAWLRSALGAPRRVTLQAHASYEGDDSQATLNQQLTRRRADVAAGIIGSDAEVTSVEALGFSVARAAGRTGDPNDRSVHIQGASAGGQAVSVRGTVSRPAPAPTTGPATGPTTGPATGPTSPAPAGTPPAAAGTPPAAPGTPPAAAGNPPAAAAAPAAVTPPIPQQPPMGIKLAFRLQKIEQIEDKTVTLTYTRQSAVQRSYAPQGLVGLLADDLDGPPHFIEVDLDSPFFRVLEIEVEAPGQFQPIGLMKADVAIDYGRPTDPVGVKHKDISFRADGPRLDKASFFLDDAHDLQYSLAQQYHFDPTSGWDGEQLSYDLPMTSSLDRTLLVTPYKHFGFLDVRVLPGDLDPDMIDSTDVFLHYEHPGRWSRDKLVTVRPGEAAQNWRLRLTDPDRRSFSYRWVHRLKDGTTRETTTVTSTIPLVTVNDPFEEPLVIEFFPNIDLTAYKLIILDVTYDDPTSTKPRVQQVRFLPTDSGSKRVRFARADPSAGKYSMQFTVLGNDNSVHRLPPVSRKDTVIFLGEYLSIERSTRRAW